ncbi:peroxidase 4 [Hibiscus syriacus]|uniref:Riboflavin synthase n=1 Tax=Hibiscus syriacus TaxID=106335 RepID=A0A6A3D5B7_HIBSY|nr:riboflavin synthase-like [Hibiscus syriacus]XP_039070240.1 riboflavin synthase-like [Hibiscus syriacus]KAE8734419.1 peroxidase 4 [Hibiscus syriacus]
MTLSTSLNSLSVIPKASPSKHPVIFNLLQTPSFRIHLKLNPIFKPSSLSLFTQPSRLTPKTQYFQTPKIRSLFTGIVEEMGEVKQLGKADHGGFDLKILAKTVIQDAHLGDSIAVNGTCLTVTDFDTHLGEFTVGLAPETLRKTSLSELKPGSLVNLERAIQPTGRMGGHFVQGHVDGTGVIVGKEVEKDSLWIKVKADKNLLKYVVPKGFIAVDGTSLTVVDVFQEELCFNFMLVDYTQHKVVIPLKEVGKKVNLEVDILGKYVERLLRSGFVDSIKSS